MRLFKATLIGHIAYILFTPLWPLLDIHSFMMVTGYKTDTWLVKTVGALLIPVSLCMLSFLRPETDRAPVFILGISTAIAFIAVDVYYSLTDVIPDIYLADAAAELFFLAAWMYLFFNHKRLKAASKT